MRHAQGGGRRVRVKMGMMGGGAHSFEDTFKNRIQAWLKDLSAGVPVSGSGEEGLRALAVIEAAIRSFNESRVVAISELLG